MSEQEVQDWQRGYEDGQCDFHEDIRRPMSDCPDYVEGYEEGWADAASADSVKARLARKENLTLVLWHSMLFQLCRALLIA